MVKEYLFSYNKTVELDLGENFDLSATDTKKKYLISNSKESLSEIYAAEINFYFENSEDELQEKIHNIKELYKARSTALDYDQTIEHSVEIGKRITIISQGEQAKLNEALQAHGFTISTLSPADISIQGHIGKLTISCQQAKDCTQSQTDQIIWFDAPQYSSAISGVYDPKSFSLEGLIRKVSENCGAYPFLNYIKHNSSICLDTLKRGASCHKCADICPTNGIVHRNGDLLFSAIDCQACGQCISICPSGALSYAQMPRASFKDICLFYREKTALLLPEGSDLERIRLPLKKDVLPFAIKTAGFLDESHLLTLIQTSGRPIIIYTDQPSEVTKEIVQLVNAIFQSKYQRPAICLCHDAKELEQAMQETSPLAGSIFQLDVVAPKKREIFSLRLAHLVGDNDLGTLSTGPHIHYGTLSLNQES
ncbi:ferredoxin [Desulfotalea psychrophila]|uniref:Related to ferredoxin n=1 Tax=Desulfotalea psychrophila (strain LSv54 / DSM 12343) TaxID=177439 RepID=Q6AIW9_DESPS|nr:ferredoxin [Desulfotalea psychrophila]CAG37711.1 related to ferredoxin [Desulfotalea psychrophila LSv54]